MFRRSAPSDSRTRRPSLFLLGLLLFALALRALVPVGYMPDVQALREGRLALAFCAAAGGLPLALRAPASMPAAHGAMGAMHGMHHAPMAHDAHGHAHHHDHGSDPDGSAAGQECPFGLIAHQALDLSSPLAAAAMPDLGRAEPPRPVDSPAPPMPAAGPPLGQRAPPRLLG